MSVRACVSVCLYISVCVRVCARFRVGLRSTVSGQKLESLSPGFEDFVEEGAGLKTEETAGQKESVRHVERKEELHEGTA